MNDIRGFMMWRPAGESARGWPEPVAAEGLSVWFQGYLAHGGGVPMPSGARVASPHQVIALAYRRWGVRGLERLQGEYAAVIVDGPTVIAGGDRMGLRPLFFHQRTGQVVVSTDLGVLAREVGARSLDEDYLADLLVTGKHLGSRTPYAGIRRLGLGQVATWRPDGFHLSAGWRPSQEVEDGDFEQHKNRLVGAVDNAIRGALPKGDVAVHLSGGLDSSTLLASIPGGRRVHAISSIFPEQPSCDETEWIHEALSRTPAPWHPVDVSRYAPFSAGPVFDRYLAAPTHAAITWAQDTVESAIARDVGASVILTGEGGDEVFLAGSLPWYLGDLMRSGDLRQAWAQAGRWSSQALAPRPVAYWLLRAGLKGWLNWRRRRELLLRPPESVASTAPWLAADYLAGIATAERTRRQMPARARSVHQQGILEGVLHAVETVRSSYPFSAHEVEMRHPYLSVQTVDRALATPWEVGVDPRVDRAVQRYAFSGRVGDATLRRRSKATSDLAIFRGLEQATEWIEMLTESPHIAGRGYVDVAEWRRSVDRATVGWLSSIHHFKVAVQVEVWLSQRHRIGTPCLLPAT